MKICSKCKENKNLVDFYSKPASRDGLSGQCKKCQSLSTKPSYERNKSKRCEQSTNARRLRLFGITSQQCCGLMIKQNGLCAICGKPEWVTGTSNRVKKLAIDHDHITGKVRGLLCHSCNLGLGYFHDNLSHIREAIKYLESF